MARSGGGGEDFALDAGDLNRRVTLLQPSYSEYEDEIQGYEPVADVFAAVNPGYGQEQTEAARTVALSQVAVVIRFRPDVDARWRVQDIALGTIYKIIGLSNVNNRSVSLQLNCQEVE